MRKNILRLVAVIIITLVALQSVSAMAAENNAIDVSATPSITAPAEETSANTMLGGASEYRASQEEASEAYEGTTSEQGASVQQGIRLSVEEAEIQGKTDESLSVQDIAPNEVAQTGVESAEAVEVAPTAEEEVQHTIAVGNPVGESEQEVESHLPEDTEEELVAEEAVEEELATAAAASNAAPSVSYTTHVQNVGWQKYVKNGVMAGTSGKAYRLEGIKIKLSGISGTIEYRTHVQNIGWQDWVSNDKMSGTSGKALRLEAIQIRLTGEAKDQYDVYYRVHAQNFGWMGWAKNGQQAGSAGYAYRLEGIQIVLVKKGGAAPSTSLNNAKQATASPYKDKNALPGKVNYKTHVQNVGWQNWVADGKMSGTSGKAYRLEGINIKLNGIKGGIQYRTHVQNIGWQGWKKDGEMSGTSGRALRLEAIQIKLTGEAAEKYDVYYRVHCQSIGWMGWAKNGEMAGTSGYGFRLEGIEIRLVEKSGTAPSQNTEAFINKEKSGCREVLVKAAWDERVISRPAGNRTVYKHMGDAARYCTIYFTKEACRHSREDWNRDQGRNLKENQGPSPALGRTDGLVDTGIRWSEYKKLTQDEKDQLWDKGIIRIYSMSEEEENEMVDQVHEWTLEFARDRKKRFNFETKKWEILDNGGWHFGPGVSSRGDASLIIEREIKYFPAEYTIVHHPAEYKYVCG